jgi:hypothetical protein
MVKKKNLGVYMQKNIFYLIALSLLTTNVFASKARLLALGEETGGSKYINDERNIFLNPAYLAVYKDFVTLELGNTSLATEDSAQRAEGGVFRSSGKTVYGFYFGDEDSQVNEMRNAAASVATSADAGVLADGDLYEQNTFSFFIGSDGTMPWGVSLKYAGHSNTTGLYVDADDDNTVDAGEGIAGEFASSTLALDVGAAYGPFELYINAGLTDTAELKDSTSDFAYAGAGNTKVGLLFDNKGSVYFLEYHTMSSEVDVASDTWSMSDIEVGWGNVQKINDDAMLFFKTYYESISHENYQYTSDLNVDISSFRASVAMEVALKDWLVLRGSVVQEIYGMTTREQGSNKSEDGNSDTTMVSAGASLTFGDFIVDGVLGDSSGTMTDSPNTYSRVSMTYKF